MIEGFNVMLAAFEAEFVLRHVCEELIRINASLTVTAV